MSAISLEPRQHSGLGDPTSEGPDDRPIWQYEAPDGKTVPDDFDSPNNTLTRRIMAAYSHLGPGKFRDLTVDGVEKEVESGMRERQDPAEPAEATEAEEKPVKELMSLEEMNAMKQDVFETLSSAWQELSFISELSRSLLPGQAYPYTDTRLGPPYVPANALTVSYIHRPTKYIAREIEDSKLALARQARDVRHAADNLSAAAGRMRSRQASTDAYWNGLIALRYGTKADGPWPLLPKWTVDGTPESKQVARDVMVPYAIDEAAPHIRLRALAAPKSDGPEASTSSTANARFGLSLPAKRGRRMRVSLSSAHGKRASRIPRIEPQSAGALLQQAQDEAFDEEVFEQIVGEARSMHLLDAQISVDRVIFRPAPVFELSFEMVDSDDDDDNEELLPGDSNPDLILAIARLAMLRIYRHRKAHQAAMSAQTSPPASARPILATIVPYLHYQAFIAQMMTILEAYQTQLDSFGFKMQIIRGDGGASGGMDWTSLLADRPEEVQAQSLSRGIDLVIEGRQMASILVSLSCQITLCLPDTTLVSQDLAQLSTFLTPALRLGVLNILRDELSERKAIAAVDELHGALLTKDIKLTIELGTLSAKSSAVAHVRRLKGSIDAHGDVRAADGVDLERLEGKDVRQWMMERVVDSTTLA